MGVDGADKPRVPPVPTATFARLFRMPVFAVLFGAELQSIAGDQLARVALSVLVFDRTGSAVATAATYAATMLPAVVGGPLVSRLGDRLPRRRVMIGIDVVRAACFAVMGVPGMPLAAMMVLLVAAVALGPAFTAAEVSYLAARLDKDHFRLATASRMVAMQAAQVFGFLLGGVAVATVGARSTLLVDAATFAVSVAAITAVGAFARATEGRPALAAVAAVAAGAADAGSGTRPARRPLPYRRATTAGASTAPAEFRDDSRTEFRGLWRTPRVRRLVALCCLLGFFVVPEGLAVPFGHRAGAGTAAIGVLLGAGALGGAIGAVALGRWVPPNRRRAVADAMAVTCGLPLLVTAATERWPVAAACWLVSGALAAYIVELTTDLVQAIPDDQRAHSLGTAGALLIAAQGAGLLIFGALAGAVSPGTSIAVAGALGSLLAAAVVLTGRERPAQPVSYAPAHGVRAYADTP